MPDSGQILFRAFMYAITGARQRLSILIYHRVVPERDWMRPALPTAAEFRWQMQLLRRHFTVLPLCEALQLLREGRLPPHAACVTFDDGYADNLTVALPILKEYEIPATIFVAAGYLDGGRMWNDTVIESLRRQPEGSLDLGALDLPVYSISDNASRRKAAYNIIRCSKHLESERRLDVAGALASESLELPSELMLTSPQLQQLVEYGIEIGAHTVTHPILTQISQERARQEIVDGRKVLEDLTGKAVRLFAYPNGQPGADYNQTHAAMVRDAGYEAALTTGWGVTTSQTDPFQLPRFTPWDRSEVMYLMRMAINSRGLVSQFRH